MLVAHTIGRVNSTDQDVSADTAPAALVRNRLRESIVEDVLGSHEVASPAIGHNNGRPKRNRRQPVGIARERLRVSCISQLILSACITQIRIAADQECVLTVNQGCSYRAALGESVTHAAPTAGDGRGE